MSRLLQLIGAALALVFFAFPAVAQADDWVVTKLRGQVLQLVGGDWAPLQRGDVVPDDRVLRTLKSGRADLQRGKEIISLGPDTQVQIHDKDGKQFTTIQQYFGQVEVEAEVRNVQHFSVQTPYFAAVVKGTHFIVSSSKAGASVKVTRGKVAVEDEITGTRTFVTVGQTAKVDKSGTLSLSGKGTLSQIVDKTGKVVAAATSSGSSTTVKAGTGSGTTAGVTAGTGGVGADVTLPGVVDTHAGVDDGVDVDVDVGDLHLGVDLGGGNDDDQGEDDQGDGNGNLLGVHLGL